MKKFISLLLLATLAIGVSWAQGATMLFHESFGDNSSSARAWDDSYSVKTGVEDVYSGITGYTVANAKQSKNTMGSTKSGLVQSSPGTDASIIIGPLNVASYSSLNLTYQWKAASIKGTYSTSAYYATSATGTYTEVTGTGNGATTFVERAYSLPQEAQVATLYIKIVFNTSNTQAIIDEVELTGIGGEPVIVTPGDVTFSPAGGEVVAGTKVTLSSTNATRILYTLDGTDPTATTMTSIEGNTGTVTITETCTIKAMGVASDGTTCGNITSADYTIWNGIKAMFNFDDDYATLFPDIDGTSSSDSNDGDITEAVTATVDGVQLTVSASDGSTPNRIWSSSPRLRMYGGTITITAPTDYLLTGIDIEQGKWNTGNTANVGNLTSESWTGEAKTLVITIAGNTQFKSMNVKCKAMDASFIAPPTITLDPAEGPYVEGTPVTVSLACETQGAAIQYALGEGEFQAYNAPFTISTTTTISAKAVKGDKESTVTTKTVTFSPAAATIAQALALETGTEFTFTGNAVVTYQNGSNLWIKDASGFGLIYQANLPTYANGDVIPAGWRATRTDHNGTKEFTNVTGLTASTQTGDGSPVVKTANEITTADENAYYQINNVQLSGTTGTITITDESGAVNGYNKFGIDMPQDGVEGKVYNVVGIIGRYNSQAQLNLVSIEDVTPHDFTLTILPATYDGTQPVEVSIVANNAVGEYMITYTTDGTDPSTSQTAVTYKTPFTIGQSCTVQAYAFDENDNEATAEKEFTINLAEFAIVPSVPAGNIYGETEVTFTPVNGFGDLTIAYTVNGGETQEATGEFTVNITETTTVEIIAEDGYGREFDDEFVYTMRDKAAAFKLVTSTEQLQQAVGKQVLIGGYVTGDDNMYVMGTQNNNNRAAVAVSLNGKDGVLDMIARTDAHAVMQLGKEGDNYTFYDIDEQGYLYAASSSSNHLKTKATLDANGKAAITVDADTHEAAIVFQGTNTRNTLRFNAGNSNTDPLFSCYSANNSQQPVYLYVEAEPEVEVEFGENNTWATYISDIDLNTPAGLQAYVVESITGDVANGTEVSYIPAGVGVLLKQVDTAQSDSYTTTVYTGQTSEHNSLLKGGTTVPEGAYLLYNDCFYQAETGELPAHRCYLELPAGTTNAPARVRISIGETTGIDGIQASDVQAVQYVNALGQTSDRPFRGVNIVVTRHNDGTVRTSKAVF